MPYATIAGTRLHYRDEGVGDPAVVLLHAFPLHSAMWEAQIAGLRGPNAVAGLSGRWRVVAPDFRGFGGSDVPDDPAAYSMDTFADDVAGLLAHLGLDRVVLGGLSMGGYAAFAVLRRHRSLVGGLVLADTRAGQDEPEVLDRRTRQQDQVRAEGTGPLVEAMVNALLSDHTREHRPDVVERARTLMSDASPAGVIGALDAMKRRPDSTADLPGIDIPTLAIVGEHDATSPHEVVAEMASRIPNARLVQIPNAGHLSNLEAPEDFNGALREFLQNC